MTKTEEQFFRTMDLPQQPISDTQYLEFIARVSKCGYPIDEFVSFKNATTIKKLRLSILEYLTETYKWYDDMENEWIYNDKIKNIVKKVLKGNK